MLKIFNFFSRKTNTLEKRTEKEILNELIELRFLYNRLSGSYERKIQKIDNIIKQLECDEEINELEKENAEKFNNYLLQKEKQD